MPPKTPPLSKEAEQGLTGPTTPDPSLLHPGHEQSQARSFNTSWSRALPLRRSGGHGVSFQGSCQVLETTYMKPPDRFCLPHLHILTRSLDGSQSSAASSHILGVRVGSRLSLISDPVHHNSSSHSLTPEPENPEHAQPGTRCRLSIRSWAKLTRIG